MMLLPQSNRIDTGRGFENLITAILQNDFSHGSDRQLVFDDENGLVATAHWRQQRIRSALNWSRFRSRREKHGEGGSLADFARNLHPAFVLTHDSIDRRQS